MNNYPTGKFSGVKYTWEDERKSPNFFSSFLLEFPFFFLVDVFLKTGPELG